MDGRTSQKLRLGSLGLLALTGLVFTASPSASDAQGDPIPAATDGADLPDAQPEPEVRTEPELPAVTPVIEETTPPEIVPGQRDTFSRTRPISAN